MKRIVIAVAALLFSAATFAQNNTAPAGGAHRPPMTAEQRAKRETDKINSITPLGTAYDKVLAANTDAAKKREGIMAGKRRDELSDDQKSQLKQLNEAHRKNLKEAMGADLFAKYEAAMKVEREKRKSEGGGGDHPAE